MFYHITHISLAAGFCGIGAVGTLINVIDIVRLYGQYPLLGRLIAYFLMNVLAGVGNAVNAVLALMVFCK